MFYIEKLYVENYRCFVKFISEFNSGMNIVAGSNGAGKTSILKAVACSLTWIAYQCGADVAVIQLEDIFRQAITYGARFRFQPQFPSICRVELRCGSDKLNVGQQCSNPTLSEWIGNGQSSQPMLENLPVLAFYTAGRQWMQSMELSETVAVSAKEERKNGYNDWTNASVNQKEFHRWLVGRSIERLQLAVERQVGFWQVEDDELAEVNRALIKALPNEFESIAYDMSAKSIVVEISGKRVDFASLSDGERSFICLFTDIARRMCLLNPQLGDKVIAETEGIVLIDELDVHLHPAWQRKIVKGLQEAFPKVQFIVTTHSPQILSEVSPQNILLLQNGKVVRPDQAKGLTSDEILRNVMGTEDRPDFAKESLDKVYEALDAGRYEEARRELDKMETIAGGPTEDTLQLGALIRTLAVSEG